MNNGDYTSFTAPSQFDNTFTLSGVASADFDMATDSPQANITAGQFRYTTGSADGGGMGGYTYAQDSFDVYAVDWLSYCDPSQNADHNCDFTNRGNDGMGGGGMGGR